MKISVSYFLALTAFTVSVVVFLTACGSLMPGSKPQAGTTMVIPDYPTAKDQYDFAVSYKESEILSPDNVKRRRVQLDKVSQCYAKVVQNFPSDQTYTPLAYMGMADCEAMNSDYAKASQMYTTIMQNYPSNAYIQARALFSIGKTYDRQGQYQLAKDTYKKVMDQYGGANQSGAIRQVVNEATQYYYQVRESPKSGKPTKPSVKTAPGF